ncbi:MAG: GNAT family N-acetyltransferase [Gemmatimonadetes bacterium]|nr:GNAT family N-acetyltransferase [Gemmatimonadota bacterium]
MRPPEMRPPELLETDRLRFRPPKLQDADWLFTTYAQDDDVTRYLAWKSHGSIEETREFLARCEKVWADGTSFPWRLERKDTGEGIGMIELLPGGAMPGMGYVLAKAHWGQGFMTEALTAVTEWVLKQPGIHRCWAICDEDNPGSARVMEKSGYRYEGLLRRWGHHPAHGELPRNCHVYSRIPEDVEEEARREDPPRDATVTLREITEDTVRPILKLKVAETQRRFVADNAISLAEANFSPAAWPRAIYADETPVGFLMLYDAHLLPEDQRKSFYYLWRFMIDERYQRSGFGRRAIELLVDHVRSRPGAQQLALTFVPGPGAPSRFYRTLGFRETGKEHDGELEMVLDLAP